MEITLKSLVRMCFRGWNIHPVNTLRPTIPYWRCGCLGALGIFSKEKDALHLEPFITQKETQGLSGLFRF